MMGKIFKLLGQIIVIAAIAYALAWIFNLLPEQYTPGTLASTNYANFKNFVAKDGASDSKTAGISKAISDYINKSEKEAIAEKAAEEQQKKEQEAKSPLNKAKAVTEEYQRQIDKQKEELDNL